jgi:hypothetical protein
MTQVEVIIDKEYIEKNINLIFDVEIRNIRNNKIYHYVETASETVKINDASSSRSIRYPVNPHKPLVDLDLSPNNSFRLEWDTYTYLKKLYNKVENLPDCRKMFLSFLEQKLSSLGAIDVSIYVDTPQMIFTTSELHSSTSLAFYFLLKIGSRDAIIRALQTKMKNNVYLDSYEDSDSGEFIDYEAYNCRDDIEGLFRDVLVFMHLEPTYFDELLLEQLTEIASCYYPVSLNIKEKLEDKILALKYNRLQTELEPSNEEINIHKEQVIGIISKYGFPQDMEKLLLEIDELPEHNLKSINSGMIGNLRSFFEALVRNIAEKILTKTGKEYPKDPSKGEMGNKRFYIKEHLELSPEDGKLIDSVVKILHKKGGHAFISEKRYFIISKNIGIEIAYFLLSVYEEKYEKNS